MVRVTVEGCVLTGSIQPLLDQDGAACQPSCVYAGPHLTHAVVMVTVRQQSPLCDDFHGLGEDVLSESNERCPAHHDAASKQYAAHTQGAQTLDLAVAARKTFGRRLQGP